MQDFFTNSQEDRKRDFGQITESVFRFFNDIAPQYGFEDRDGQQDMALDICQAWEDKEHIAVEAGVGIGKSFAYIVPLLYYHKKFNKPVVIATSTIALQEQLIGDIRKIEDMLHYHPPIILAKGQSHFFCKKRAEDFAETSKGHYRAVVSNAILLGGLVHKEKSEFKLDIDDYLWNKMNVQEYNYKICTTDCKSRSTCYYLKLRDDMRLTNGIVVCNQNLLTMNQIKIQRDQKGLLPENIPFMVIDEAHNLESIVRNTLTESYDRFKIKRIIRQAAQIVDSNRINLNVYVERLEPLIDAIFSNLDCQIQSQTRSSIRGEEIDHYFVDNNIPELSQTSGILNTMTEEAEINYGVDDYWRHKRSDDTTIENLADLNRFFASFAQAESHDIFWMESKANSITIYRCPKNMSKEIKDLFFSDTYTKVVLTSATMCTESKGDVVDKYQYFIRNTGFPTKKGLGFLSDPKESPFDYNSHALIYCTDALPHPTNDRDDFIEKGTELIIDLLNITRGKALILFTAKTDLDLVYNKLQSINLPYKIIKQGTDSSQASSIAQFKDNTDSVLLGAGTFWKGIDVEGEALTNLIIFRLPFPVPDPIIDYKCSLCKNRLMEVLAPEMVIKLKQGIGRLIRSKTDRGIVSILDPRLGTKSAVEYKDQVWDALPIKNRTDDIDKLKDFYDSLF